MIILVPGERLARLGTTCGQIGNYKRVTREPDLETLRRFAEFFDVTLDFLGGKSDQTQGGEDKGKSVSEEESTFLKWVEDNLEDEFYYDFDASPEESKAQMMADLRYLWEREKKRNKK